MAATISGSLVSDWVESRGTSEGQQKRTQSRFEIELTHSPGKNRLQTFCRDGLIHFVVDNLSDCAPKFETDMHQAPFPRTLLKQLQDVDMASGRLASFEALFNGKPLKLFCGPTKTSRSEGKPESAWPLGQFPLRNGVAGSEMQHRS